MAIRGDGIDWKIVLNGVLTASVVGLAATTVEQGHEIAALKARQEIVLQRLQALETGSSSATSERYRASDAARDFRRVEQRLDKIEEKLWNHESDDKLRFKSQGSISK